MKGCQTVMLTFSQKCPIFNHSDLCVPQDVRRQGSNQRQRDQLPYGLAY